MVSVEWKGPLVRQSQWLAHLSFCFSFLIMWRLGLKMFVDTGVTTSGETSKTPRNILSKWLLVTIGKKYIQVTIGNIIHVVVLFFSLGILCCATVCPFMVTVSYRRAQWCTLVIPEPWRLRQEDSTCAQGQLRLLSVCANHYNILCTAELQRVRNKAGAYFPIWITWNRRPWLSRWERHSMFPLTGVATILSLEAELLLQCHLFQVQDGRKTI